MKNRNSMDRPKEVTIERDEMTGDIKKISVYYETGHDNMKSGILIRGKRGFTIAAVYLGLVFMMGWCSRGCTNRDNNKNNDRDDMETKSVYQARQDIHRLQNTIAIDGIAGKPR